MCMFSFFELLELSVSLAEHVVFHLALKDRQQARKILEQIVRSYRGSPEAGKASGRLAQLQGSR